MMLLRTHSPLAAYSGLRTELDRLFNNLWGQGVPSTPTFPGMNVWEEESAYVAEVEVPGMELKDIEITVAGDELTIKGRREPRTEDGWRYLRRERPWGEFTRAVTLPGDVNADAVEARLSHGVLRIHLPKVEEAKPRRITVKAE
jgi:HSP20 family protein